jgi:hypothetical protein
MRCLLVLPLLALPLLAVPMTASSTESGAVPKPRTALVIHGGAGSW